MTNLSKTEAIKIYKDMLLGRKFEEKCIQAYGKGMIIGFCHLYIGQEAIATALYKAKNKKDDVITSYRCHVQALLAGETPEAVMGELMGKKIGSSKGKGGSMHIFSPENNFWGGHGIVGASAPLGAGIAFANKYNENNNICIAMYGDGACDQGQVFESYNMASLWSLPVLFIIENNFYSMGTACSRHSSLSAGFHAAGKPFGIETKSIEGMDFEVCYKEIKEAIEYVRKNSKPFILQIDCYRFRGHSMSDAGNTYREKEEIERYKKIDPIATFKNKNLSKFNLTEDEINQLEEEVEEQIDKAFEMAKSADFPNAEELFQDLY